MATTKTTPAATILVIDGRYHFGNNPGVFQSAAYIGWSLVLPIFVSWYDNKATEVAFIVHTQDIESWGGTGGHRVLLNGTEIGRLKDPDQSDPSEPMERFRLAVPMSKFEEILAGQKNARLTIDLEVSSASPSLADDFVLRRIETEETLALRLGTGP